ncbi:class I SAM-dependent methyltransferase [Phenylobacterium sp.]|uniref:class I SAM-dependent methyltransferase n=1 Tax=Phenylobacterium sp. TaxID=1871053 RepID=UPI0025D03BC5|nr:class I SAM-dependent methyltransferase [Phenylobacterium sp.]
MQQAVRPQGAFGVVMGWLMGGLNAAQNRATVDALDPPPGGAVLEIGFGPGRALEMLANKVPLGLVAGIDHSELMVARARRRLNGHRGDAALDLRLGEAGDLPFPDEKFDVAFAVNSFHLWPDPERALAEMAGVLKPGGDLLLSIRDVRNGGRFEAPGKGQASAKAAVETMRDLGLQVRQREIVHSPSRATLLVRGRKCGRADG